MTAFAAIASKRGALADMEKAAIDIAQALARLSELTIFELRGEWRRLHRMPPPMRLSRDLLTRGITYKLQERAYGGLSMATARKLERASADPLGRGAAKPTPPISLKPGTRLVRPRLRRLNLHQNPAETLHIRRLENGLERPRGRSRPAPRHLASLVAADAFAG